MRIIAGTYRRRQIQAPPGFLTRPSADRTRESLFNMVEARVNLDEADVLDLFAGTGALGLEALSRGARSAVFVESEPRVLKYTRQNAASLEAESACTFVGSDAVAYLKRDRGEGFDAIFADPPYELPSLPALPDLAIRRLRPGGLFILEHDVTHQFDEHSHLDTSRRYGRTTVSIFASGPLNQSD